MEIAISIIFWSFIALFVLLLLFWILIEIDFALFNKKSKNQLRQLTFRQESLDLIYCTLVLQIFYSTYREVYEEFESWYDYFLLPIDMDSNKKYKNIQDVWRAPNEYNMLLTYVKENANEEEFLQWASQLDIPLSRFAAFI